MTSSSKNAILYGQVVVGPPGAGKTTYCNGMQQYLRLLQRNAWVMNMDPANDPGDLYETIFDVRHDMVDLSVVMDEMELGPNGGLMYCMEYMEQHVTDIVNYVRKRQQQEQESESKTKDNPLYLLLDFPGQVELYTHSTCVVLPIGGITRDNGNVADGVAYSERMDEMDLLRGNDLPMPWEFFTECFDLERLIPFLDHTNMNKNGHEEDYDNIEDDERHNAVWEDPDYQAARRRRKESKLNRKYTKLHEVMAEVVEDFGLLNFTPLDIQDATLVGRVLAKVDQCNGYVYTQQSIPEDMFQCAAASSNYTGEAQLQIRERIHSSPPSSNQQP
ncbi:hypothetical protein FisN_2Hh395 [Fistulifera solaris]|uniref:GPN-loop GTPase 2 n=1 Tax=Fistulifera solaris TaxID=1519565 RepID=A0A1Z5KKD8_FISSO|nr:hypothetical protein FisN_2Hh395 [Fistulifera solaris]|eukprot:GAX26667.1 hypothetical protein FisN_2Hh395 [Fistulifera solaris]